MSSSEKIPVTYSCAIEHLTPTRAWHFLQNTSQATFIDVRMEIEALYVGHPPGAINIPWYEYPDFETHIEKFSATVRGAVKDKHQPVVLICRSGTRTIEAGKALINQGFTRVINVLHGFEGDLNENGHRSTINGWRFEGLPWRQM